MNAADGRRNIAVAAGILLMVGGLIGLGVTYREMKLQRHLHDKLAGVRIQLAQGGSAGSEPFVTLRDGLHTLHIATLTAAHPAARAAGPYAGMVEYSIADSAGRLRYLGRIFPGNIPGLVPDSATLLTLDTVYIPDAGAPLLLSARVMAPDTSFTRTASELFLMPPSDASFGDDLRRQSMYMAAMGLTMVIGFSILVFGGRARRSP